MWKIIYLLNNNQIKHSITDYADYGIIDVSIDNGKGYIIQSKDNNYILKNSNGIIVSESNIDTFINKLINCDYIKKFS